MTQPLPPVEANRPLLTRAERNTTLAWIAALGPIVICAVLYEAAMNQPHPTPHTVPIPPPAAKVQVVTSLVGIPGPTRVVTITRDVQAPVLVAPTPQTAAPGTSEPTPQPSRDRRTATTTTAGTAETSEEISPSMKAGKP